MSNRKGTCNRKTNESDVMVSINLDGSGVSDISTGNGMLDHLLSQLAKHGLFDIVINTKGDWLQTGWQHTVEDTAIAFGRAFNEALGEGSGSTRMGHAIVPLDEALARVVVALSGRGYGSINLNLSDSTINDLPGDLVRHFLLSFSTEAKLNLHATVLEGINAHHKAEATFKALARALKVAVSLDPARAGQIPSTKGSISE